MESESKVTIDGQSEILDSFNETEIKALMQVLRRDMDLSAEHIQRTQSFRVENKNIPGLLSRWTDKLIGFFYRNDFKEKGIKTVQQNNDHDKVINNAISRLLQRDLESISEQSPSDRFYYQSCKRLMNIRTRECLDKTRQADRAELHSVLRQPPQRQEYLFDVKLLLEEMIDFVSEALDGISTSPNILLSLKRDVYEAKPTIKPKRPTTLNLNSSTNRAPYKTKKSAPITSTHLEQSGIPLMRRGHLACTPRRRVNAFSIDSERGALLNSPVRTPDGFYKSASHFFGSSPYDFNDIRRWQSQKQMSKSQRSARI
ncbi:hypothetical protein ACOME3_004949 [Neoechinorhynchus agilis]